MSNTTEDNHRRITAFLSSAFAMRENRQCTRVQLTFGRAGAPGDELGNWERKDYPDPDLSPFDNLALCEELVTKIVEASERYAETTGMEGNHRFEVRAHQALGGRTKCAFQVFVDNGDGTTEGRSPDATGVLAMTIAHTEFFVKQNAAIVGTSIGALKEMVRDLTAENTQLRKERADFFLELEDARSQQSERDLLGIAQTASDERKKLTIEKLLQFAPIIASKLLASGEAGAAANVSGAAAPLTLIINELADSMSQEQIMKILPALNAPQQAMFIETFKMARAAADAAAAVAAQAQAQAGAHSTSNGTASAGAAGARP